MWVRFRTVFYCFIMLVRVVFSLLLTGQVIIPALFMLLLVWIKSLTSVYDSPATLYSCGQTLPWQYEEHLDPFTFDYSPLLHCLQKPPNCSADNYYRDEGGLFGQLGLEGVSELPPIFESFVFGVDETQLCYFISENTTLEPSY